MTNPRKINHKYLYAIVATFFLATNANALTIDWSGYFRADHNFVHNYQMDKSSPGYSNSGDSGEYIKGEGKKSTTYSSLFMKIKPRVLVNDNIVIHSEWNVGDPVAGFFGRGIPKEDRTNPFSTGKDSMSLTVARLWLDTHTDFGTLQVGRAPMNWGLGVIFNAGDEPFDRYQSTSDTIRLISKFGYLSLMPLYAKNSVGRNLAGASNPLTSTILQGSDDITDYGLALKYENPEEDLEAGVIFYKRNASDAQTSYYYPTTSTSYTGGANGMNLKLYDFYARKTWHRLELGAEVPIYSGQVGDINGVGSRNEYRATAFALEAKLKYDTWLHQLKMGSVPGQESATTGARGSSFGALHFHRSYKLGQILFGYNLGGFGAANPDAIPGAASGSNETSDAVSPYDTSITNAKYLMFATEKRWEQWSINLGAVFAQANQTAATGKDAFNHRTRQWFTSNATQGKSMGFEVDLGTRYRWDDQITFGADIGMFFPGEYYKFINNATRQGPADPVTALSLVASTVF